MVDDISKLYAKILEEQNEKDNKTPIIENHLIEENESQINDSLPKEEPFDNFLLKLSEKIAEHLDISEEAEDNQNEEVDDSENNYDGIPLEKQTTKSSYIEELQKIDKGDKSKLISKNDNISATISEQVKEEIGKVKTQISRMAIEGGGGSVAVQYAKGGVMNGDLNVTGKYLSGGIDLSTLIGSGGSGGGGLSGTTDRLVSGTEVFKLNTDGTFNFPNNIITPQDEVILTLEATKVLDGYYNRLALSPHGFFASDHNGNSITIDSTDNEILIDSNNTYFWKFNNQGALEGPFGTLSVSGNLSATGRVYQNGNDLQTEIENISSFATSTKTTIQSNSASWDYQGSDIKALTGNWQEAYTNLVTNSAAYLSSVDLSFLSVSTNWDSVYTTVLNESASWIGGGGLTGEYLPLSGGVMTGPISFSYPYGSKLDQGIYDSSRGGLSGISLVCSVNYDFNWQAGWITALEQDRLTPRPLYIDSGAGTSLRVWDGRNYPTSGIEISHSQITFADNTTQITAFTGNTLTFDESTKDLSISNGNTVSLSALVDISSIDTGVRLLTSNWESTYTTVYSNSANWQGLYTTVQTNSSTWVNGISAQVILARVFNADSVTMNKGDVVYTFGATGDVMSVKLASNVSEATSSKTLGFVNETIATGGIGYVVIAGQIDKMSFPNPFQEGDALWLGETAGTFTRVKPTAPNHLVYLGVVERANNGNGLAYVKVQNGYELDELHDVRITSVSAGDVLQRNATNTLWVNSPLSADKWNSSYTTVKTNSAAWAAPSTFFQAYEHFITGGGIGLLGITYSGLNGGSVTQVTTNPAVFGAVRIATANNSTANTGARINGSGTINTINPTGVGEFRYVSRIMQFSTDFFSSTCRGIFRTGVGDSINASPSNGFFFSATESNTVNFNTVSGGITTSTPTGFSIIQNQWNLFEFIISASGTSVTAKINGNTVATHTTNIPNAYMYPITNILKYQADAGFIQLDVDYIYISLTQ